MQQQKSAVKTVASLSNVSLAAKTMEQGLTASLHLPRMLVLSGPSGYGKSSAACYLINKYNAYYIACMGTWSRKAVLENILKDMGIVPAKTMYQMTDQVCEQLATSRRPLIVDEVDYLVDKGIVEILRDIYEGSRAVIMLIGEENLPTKLIRWERFHNRILEWAQALPADLDDVAELAGFYCTRVTIADDLLAHIHAQTKRNVRRICVNLEHVQETALSIGFPPDRPFGLADWGNRPLYTGEAPKRRLS